MSVLPACVSVHCVPGALGEQRSVSDPLELTGAIDSCELPCGCWEMNLCPLEEQSVLATADPSFQLYLKQPVWLWEKSLLRQYSFLRLVLTHLKN